MLPNLGILHMLQPGNGRTYKNQNVELQKEHPKSIKASE
jgi:hypothetical protein